MLVLKNEFQLFSRKLDVYTQLGWIGLNNFGSDWVEFDGFVLI